MSNSDTDNDYITIELRVRPALLRSNRVLPTDQLREDDALSQLLGRQALALGRRVLVNIEEERNA